MSLCLLLFASLTASAGAPPPADPNAPLPQKASVVEVYDGDTMTLATGDKVRLAGVNTPELKPLEDYGTEAREATRALCLEKEAVLEYGEVTRDGYGRLIAGVTCDGKDLAMHLLELGLGHVFLIPPEVEDPAPALALQDQARAANRGIWSTERYKGELHITSFHANAAGDDRENVNGEYLRVANVSSSPLELSGYQITDLSGRSWSLPSLIVPAGHTFKLISGVGTNQGSPDSQLEVYLGSDQPVWNNKRDRATIYDRHGRVVDSRDHEVASDPNP